MQRHLSRFTHGADKQADTGHGHQRPFSSAPQVDGLIGQLRRSFKYFRVVQRTEIGQHQANAQNEAEITDAVDQEGLQVGEDGRFAVHVETDQQVRHQTHRFPTEEQLHEVVAHDEHQHREGEQADVREETAETVIFGHVADGVDMDQQ